MKGFLSKEHSAVTATAEGWLAQSGSKDPQPAELHREFLTFSRTVVNRLQRLVISSVVVASVLVLGLAAFSFYKSNWTIKIARVATSKSLTTFALMEQEKDPELNLLLATELVRTTRDTGETVTFVKYCIMLIARQIQS